MEVAGVAGGVEEVLEPASPPVVEGAAVPEEGDAASLPDVAGWVF